MHQRTIVAATVRYLAVIGSLVLSGAAAVDLPAPIGRPWLGYGVNIEPAPGGGTSPGPYTPAEAALDDTRIGAIKPQIARVTWTTLGFAPTGKVGVYDWTTTWAKNEFIALDKLKARNIPIMTGWWDTPWDATSSDHATAAADFLEYLVKTKGYTNIFAWDGINEPNHRDPTTYARWKTEVVNVKAAIAGRNLPVDIEILGPGMQDVDASTAWLKSASSEMSGDLDGYDIHYYPTSETGIAKGEAATVVKRLVSAAESVATSHKPFYIEELGWKYGSIAANDTQPNAVTYSYGLNMADLAIQVVRAGASAPIAWRLSDLGSPRLWGMYDGSNGNTALRPWSYSWTMLSRAFPKGAILYGPPDTSSVRTLVGSTGSGTATRWSLATVNQGSSQVSITLHLPKAAQATFTRYYYYDGDRATDADGFPAGDGSVIANSADEVTIDVPVNSFVLLTNSPS